MDASLISGVAALAGAAIGGFTSAVAAWFSQRETANAQWRTTQTLRRQDLYRDFIEGPPSAISTRSSMVIRTIPAW
jgi:predicted ribosomally synthesized peptide with SipW-like signal peptide